MKEKMYMHIFNMTGCGSLVGRVSVDMSVMLTFPTFFLKRFCLLVMEP